MSRRILIVEDDEAISNLIAMNLRVAGMEYRVIDDGEDAVRSLSSDHAYDLAVLDVMLPRVDGFGVFEALKPYAIPVIFLTAKDDIASKLRGLTGGAEDYMVKPFDVLELLVRMDKVISRSSKTEDTIEIGDVTICSSERRVMKSGEEVVMKPLEFDLLLTLAKHRNIALSRDDLIALVWGSNYLGETRTVDVHIAKIRSKLDMADVIKTVPKVGYRLEDRIK